MERIRSVVVFFLFTYPVGLVIGIGFWLLRLVGVLKVKGWGNFPHWRQRVLVVSNHPSLVEPILLTGLFFHQYVLRPFKYGPWTLADRRNYYDRYPILRSKLIPVDRTRAGDPGSLVAAKQVLESGGNLIVFPEGGRTFKGTSFLESRSGRKMRPLKEGFAFLAVETNAVLLPLWFEGSFRSGMRIAIGEAMIFTGGTPRNEVVEITERILLELADKTN
ncbi:MAG TPA: lysophospholipid acyltransferase family protein [bacterium]